MDTGGSVRSARARKPLCVGSVQQTKWLLIRVQVHEVFPSITNKKMARTEVHESSPSKFYSVVS